MNLSSPLTRAKARELARAQSPSRSVLTEPLYSSPRGSLLDNTDTSRRRKTSSRSASKFKENNTTYSSPTDEKENISINRVHKSRDQRHLDIQKRNGSEAESHQINFNRYSSFQVCVRF